MNIAIKPGFDFKEQSVSDDYRSLLSSYSCLSKDLASKKAEFEKCLKNSKDYDYLSVVIARLAYIFVKEKQETLCEEIEKRGIETNISV